MAGQWTPGKWSADGWSVSSDEGVGDIVCEKPGFAASYKYWPANARLIAAAPDLVEALAELEGCVSGYLYELGDAGTVDAACAKARAALAKAGAL